MSVTTLIFTPALRDGCPIASHVRSRAVRAGIGIVVGILSRALDPGCAKTPDALIERVYCDTILFRSEVIDEQE